VQRGAPHCCCLRASLIPRPSRGRPQALFRRAAARRLLARWDVALADCEQALARLAAGGGGGRAGEQRSVAAEVAALQAAIEEERQSGKAPMAAAAAEAESAATKLAAVTLGGEADPGAAAPGEQQPDRPTTQPHAGPSLAALDALLAAAHAALRPATQHARSSGSEGGGGGEAPPLRARYSPGAGRYLTAARPLPAGTDLLTEPPLLAIPARGARATACWRCLAPLADGGGGGAAPFPCGGCAAARFCSAACRAAAAGDHAPECGRPWPLLVPPEAWLTARLARRRAMAACGGDSCSVGDSGGGEAAGGEPEGGPLLDALVGSLPTQFWIADTLGPAAAAGGRGGGSPKAAAADAAGVIEEEAEERLRQVALACLLAGVQAQVAADDSSSSGGGPGSPPAAEGGGSGTGFTPADALRARGVVAACGVAARPDRAAGAGDWRGLGVYPLTAAVVNHSCDPNCSLRWGLVS
jgi:hypothetical protein